MCSALPLVVVAVVLLHLLVVVLVLVLVRVHLRVLVMIVIIVDDHHHVVAIADHAADHHLDANDHRTEVEEVEDMEVNAVVVVVDMIVVAIVLVAVAIMHQNMYHRGEITINQGHFKGKDTQRSKNRTHASILHCHLSFLSSTQESMSERYASEAANRGSEKSEE